MFFNPVIADAAVDVVDVAADAADEIVAKTSVFTDFFASIGLSSVSSLLSAILVFLLCAVAIKVVTGITNRLFARSRLMDETVKRFLKTAIKIVLWCLAIVIIAGTLGIPTASLVAVVSVAGLALSLSMQNILSNLFSGITLLLNRPMSVGDYVEVAGNGGTVHSIGLFYTVLISPNKQVLTIPNSDVASATITNYNREPNRRVQFTFGADYGDATADVFAALLDAASECGKVLSDPAPEAFINSYQDSNIEYGLNVWCLPGDYWDVLHDINALVREQFAKHGVSMSYNQINVHMMKD